MKNQFEYRVYRNLNNQKWSIKHKNNPIKHSEEVLLQNVSFYSRPAGREKVIETGVKNVHAYMCSNQKPDYHADLTQWHVYPLELSSLVQISYNPKLDPRFFFKLGSEKIFIEPNWVLDEVVSEKGKIWTRKITTHKLLKSEKVSVPNLNLKLFFDGDLDLVNNLKKHLSWIIDNKEKIEKLSESDSIRDIEDDSLVLITDYGLCDNLKLKYSSVSSERNKISLWLQTTCKDWQHFSGSPTFPIPDPSKNEVPDVIYHKQPLYKGSYGNLRFDLAKFLLESLN
jgi:hypothetical protein